VLIPWLLKWLRVRIPFSTDDPNTESTTPFLVETLPADVTLRFEPLSLELSTLGFLDPIYHVFQDPGTSTTIFWATFRHSSGCTSRAFISASGSRQKRLIAGCLSCSSRPSQTERSQARPR